MHHELVVDSFAGGGGASFGIELATGRSPDIAINHDAESIALHKANHPGTRHYTEDVWHVDPVEATRGQRVGLMWLSPDCKHFSKAKGSAPVSPRVRGLAWTAVRWAQSSAKPRVLVLENVEEFQTWGPIARETQRPDPNKKGKTFRAFCNKLRKLGYEVQHRELRACDFGAPTIRRRLFLVARCDGQPIVWPKATHGKHLRPWRTAAECIDWTRPCPSIFTRKKPLAANTMKRVAAGLRRYVIETDRPFIVRDVLPFITEHANASNQRNMSAGEPLRTQCASVKGGHFALVSAFVAKHYTERKSGDVNAASLFGPTPTVTSVDHNALVAAHIVKLRGDNVGHAADEPLHTISAQGTHHGLVRAFMVKYYGTDQDPQLTAPLHTITTKDRFGLVTVDGADYEIADIGMRMLAPRELYRAQGFPDSYQIDIPFNGKPMTKTAQVRMVGNSVCPPVAAAIVRANYAALVYTPDRSAAA